MRILQPDEIRSLRFKTRLKSDADIEIERLKNSLQMLAMEHQVRFSKLHEKRAEVIGEVYKRLTDLNLHGERFVITAENNPSPYKEKEFDANIFRQTIRLSRASDLSGGTA